MGKAYLVQDVLCSMERYAYCDPATQMVVDFPSSAPGLEGKRLHSVPKTLIASTAYCANVPMLLEYSGARLGKPYEVKRFEITFSSNL